MNGHKPRNTRTFKLFSYGLVLCVWEFSYCLHFKNLYFTKLTPYSVLILNHNLNFNEFPTWNTGLIIKNNNRFKKWTFVGRMDLFCPTLTKINLSSDLFSSKINTYLWSVINSWLYLFRLYWFYISYIFMKLLIFALYYLCVQIVNSFLIWNKNKTSCDHCKIHVFSFYSETKIVFGSNNVTHLVQV